jgi:hypothetical protein
MHFQTQANGNTRGGLTCVQYRISSDQLLRRSWPSGNPGAVSGWWTVTDAVVNADLTPAVPAFQLDSSSAQGGGTALGSRLVNIVLVMNAKTSDGPNVQIQDSIEIRNQTSVSGDPCTPPAG